MSCGLAVWRQSGLWSIRWLCMKASKGRSDRALGTQEGHATWCEGEGAAKGSRQETTSSRMAGEIRGTWVTAYGLRDGIRKARPSGGCGCKKGLER
eukprot:scaffold79406_cov32-Tisochrysis_lutea.AAC.4